MSTYLKYIGKGSGSIPGVPARDLTYEEARKFDLTHLLASGLYIYNSDAAVPEEYKTLLGVASNKRPSRRKKESE